MGFLAILREEEKTHALLSEKRLDEISLDRENSTRKREDRQRT